jgi:hypothetical protein
MEPHRKAQVGKLGHEVKSDAEIAQLDFYHHICVSLSIVIFHHRLLFQTEPVGLPDHEARAKELGKSERSNAEKGTDYLTEHVCSSLSSPCF